jgi:hypothetical protein
MLTIDDSQRCLVIDVSRYENRMDPVILQSNGVALPIIKCSSGKTEDTGFRAHAATALRVYKKIAVYHWIDPTISALENSNTVLNLLSATKFPIAFVMLDFEQWWADWSRWYMARNKQIPMSDVPEVSGSYLSLHALAIKRAVADVFRTVTYVGKWFLDSYSPQARTWLANEETVISAYPHQPPVRTKMTWQQLKPYYPTALPIGVGNIIGHQFSGDRCMLPGVYEISAGKEINPGLDVSMFDIGFLQSCGVNATPVGTFAPAPTPPVPPVPPPAPVGIKFAWGTANGAPVQAVNVRGGPSANYPIVKILYKTTTPFVYLIIPPDPKTGYAQLADGSGWVFFNYFLKA